MDYEALLDKANAEGLSIKEKPFKTYDGRIKGKNIYLRKDMNTTEKACVLAEELGHHYTTTGNILDQSKAENRKQEYIARLWAYNKQIGLMGLIKAFNHGCRTQYEIAEYLDVTEEFLSDAIECYTAKYGTCVNMKDYIIYFMPELIISKMIQ